MRFLLITLILLFYIFFFIRAYTLSKSLGTKIKAENLLLNASIFFAGISSVIFLVYLFFPITGKYFIVLYSSDLLTLSGSVVIALGLVASCAASLSLKNSWRIGINEDEKTELITGGIYRFSRNPYFLSYDLVLAGMVLSMISPVLIATFLITVIMFHKMILNEEEYLERHHGISYREYKEAVRRYI